MMKNSEKLKGMIKRIPISYSILLFSIALLYFALPAMLEKVEASGILKEKVELFFDSHQDLQIEEAALYAGNERITAKDQLVLDLDESAYGGEHMHMRFGTNGAVLTIADTDYPLPYQEQMDTAALAAEVIQVLSVSLAVQLLSGWAVTAVIISLFSMVLVMAAQCFCRYRLKSSTAFKYLTSSLICGGMICLLFSVAQVTRTEILYALSGSIVVGCYTFLLSDEMKHSIIKDYSGEGDTSYEFY